MAYRAHRITPSSTNALRARCWYTPACTRLDDVAKCCRDQMPRLRYFRQTATRKPAITAWKAFGHFVAASIDDTFVHQISSPHNVSFDMIETHQMQLKPFLPDAGSLLIVHQAGSNARALLKQADRDRKPLRSQAQISQSTPPSTRHSGLRRHIRRPILRPARRHSTHNTPQPFPKQIPSYWPRQPRLQHLLRDPKQRPVRWQVMQIWGWDTENMWPQFYSFAVVVYFDGMTRYVGTEPGEDI